MNPDILNPPELLKLINKALKDHSGLTRKGANWYRHHPELIWVVHPRRLFGGSQFVVDVAVSATDLSAASWPKDNQSQLQTSYEALSEAIPSISDSPRLSGRSSLFAAALNSETSQEVMLPRERDQALRFMAQELEQISSSVRTLSELSGFFQQPSVQRPLLDKRLRTLLGMSRRN